MSCLTLTGVTHLDPGGTTKEDKLSQRRKMLVQEVGGPAEDVRSDLLCHLSTRSKGGKH